MNSDREDKVNKAISISLALKRNPSKVRPGAIDELTSIILELGAIEKTGAGSSSQRVSQGLTNRGSFQGTPRLAAGSSGGKPPSKSSKPLKDSSGFAAVYQNVSSIIGKSIDEKEKITDTAKKALKELVYQMSNLSSTSSSYRKLTWGITKSMLSNIKALNEDNQSKFNDVMAIMLEICDSMDGTYDKGAASPEQMKELDLVEIFYNTLSNSKDNTNEQFQKTIRLFQRVLDELAIRDMVRLRAMAWYDTSTDMLKYYRVIQYIEEFCASKEWLDGKYKTIHNVIKKNGYTNKVVDIFNDCLAKWSVKEGYIKESKSGDILIASKDFHEFSKYFNDAIDQARKQSGEMYKTIDDGMKNLHEKIREGDVNGSYLKISGIFEMIDLFSGSDQTMPLSPSGDYSGEYSPPSPSQYLPPSPGAVSAGGGPVSTMNEGHAVTTDPPSSQVDPPADQPEKAKKKPAEKKEKKSGNDGGKTVATLIGNLKGQRAKTWHPELEKVDGKMSIQNSDWIREVNHSGLEPVEDSGKKPFYPVSEGFASFIGMHPKLRTHTKTPDWWVVAHGTESSSGLFYLHCTSLLNQVYDTMRSNIIFAEEYLSKDLKKDKDDFEKKKFLLLDTLIDLYKGNGIKDSDGDVDMKDVSVISDKHPVQVAWEADEANPLMEDIADMAATEVALDLVESLLLNGRNLEGKPIPIGPRGAVVTPPKQGTSLVEGRPSSEWGTMDDENPNTDDNYEENATDENRYSSYKSALEYIIADECYCFVPVSFGIEFRAMSKKHRQLTERIIKELYPKSGDGFSLRMGAGII